MFHRRSRKGIGLARMLRASVLRIALSRHPVVARAQIISPTRSRLWCPRQRPDRDANTIDGDRTTFWRNYAAGRRRRSLRTDSASSSGSPRRVRRRRPEPIRAGRARDPDVAELDRRRGRRLDDGRFDLPGLHRRPAISPGRSGSLRRAGSAAPDGGAATAAGASRSPKSNFTVTPFGRSGGRIGALPVQHRCRRHRFAARAAHDRRAGLDDRDRPPADRGVAGGKRRRSPSRRAGPERRRDFCARRQHHGPACRPARSRKGSWCSSTAGRSSTIRTASPSST